MAEGIESCEEIAGEEARGDRALASLKPSWVPPRSASCLERESHVPRPVSCAPRGGQATSSAPYLLHSATGAKPQGHIDDFDIVKAEKAEQAAAKPEKPVHAIDPLIPIRLPGYLFGHGATSILGKLRQSLSTAPKCRLVGAWPKPQSSPH